MVAQVTLSSTTISKQSSYETKSCFTPGVDQLGAC